MRVVQLIDSLEPGGAERMAVNIANGLANELEFSALVTTRLEGDLKPSVKDNVVYEFLERKKIVDINAIFRFKKFLKSNQISIIHAHSSSYFFACLTRVFFPSVKIIWHDHYGNSEFLEKRPFKILKFCARSFDTVISVNNQLKRWAIDKLEIGNCHFIPNFSELGDTEKRETFLKGEDGKRVVCLANLRPQKDHITLLKAANLLFQKYPDFTLHLVGKDFNDEYSKSIKELVQSLKLDDNVFFYGSCQDIPFILSQATIGVLSSKSEGLPVALLEYGLSKLAVVVTDVGQCSEVVQHKHNGIVVSSLDEESLYLAIEEIVIEDSLKVKYGERLLSTIKKDYSVNSYLMKLRNIYEATSKR